MSASAEMAYRNRKDVRCAAAENDNVLVGRERSGMPESRPVTWHRKPVPLAYADVQQPSVTYLSKIFRLVTKSELQARQC